MDAPAVGAVNDTGRGARTESGATKTIKIKGEMTNYITKFNTYFFLVCETNTVIIHLIYLKYAVVEYLYDAHRARPFELYVLSAVVGQIHFFGK